MPSLELDDQQAALLSDYLYRALSELSTEISATDDRGFRERIKAERRELRAIVDQLAAAASHGDAAARGER